MARFVTSLAFAVALAASVACTGKDPYNPGQPIGAFHVSAALVSSTCGATPNPWEFDVKLRHDAQTIYWVQGGAPVQGTLDAKAHAVMSSKDARTLRAADTKRHLASCVVTRADSLDVVLDQGSAPASDPSAADALTGTLAYRFEPTTGSDCSDQTSATGGDFDALPCEVSYTLTGRRTGDVRP